MNKRQKKKFIKAYIDTIYPEYISIISKIKLNKIYNLIMSRYRLIYKLYRAEPNSYEYKTIKMRIKDITNNIKDAIYTTIDVNLYELLNDYCFNCDHIIDNIDFNLKSAISHKTGCKTTNKIPHVVWKYINNDWERIDEYFDYEKD